MSIKIDRFAPSPAVETPYVIEFIQYIKIGTNIAIGKTRITTKNSTQL